MSIIIPQWIMANGKKGCVPTQDPCPLPSNENHPDELGY